MAVNKVVIVGNLGRDPELKYTQGGTAICKFSVACSEKFKQGEEWKERTEWINVQAWGQLGERCGENLHKGSKVFIEGKITTNSWEGKDGQKHYSTSVTAAWVEWFAAEKSSKAKDEVRDSTKPQDDDIPF